MSITRFMSRLFSATEQKDEELTAQVAEDIESAKESGSVDTEEMAYEHIGDGHVLATDKETGEVTHILPNVEDHELYDLEDVTDDVERFLHPVVGDTVMIAEEDPSENNEKYLHPVVGDTVMYEQDLCEGECNDPACECNEQRTFSVSSSNTIVNKIFSEQEEMEEATEETIRSEQVVELGDMKFEKLSDSEVLVTDKSSGDKAKVALDGPEMEVTELDEKSFKMYSETINKMKSRKVTRKIYSEEEVTTFYVVGIDPTNQILVNVPVYSEQAAHEMAAELSEKGVEALNMFVCPNEAREYAWALLNNEGVESEEAVGEEEKTFSDNGSTIYCNRFFTDRTRFMNRLFSEAEAGIDTAQNIIEVAAEDGVQLETETEIITPVDSETVVVEDKETGEYTKVELVGDEMQTEAISRDEAEDLTDDLEVDEEANEDAAAEIKEKEFSERGWAKMYSDDKITEETKGKMGGVVDAMKKAVDFKDKNGNLRAGKIAATAAGAAGLAAAGILGARYLKKKKAEKAAEGVEEKKMSEIAEEAEIKDIAQAPEESAAVEQPTLEAVEDKAQDAIEAIQETVDAAVEAIEEAKAAPVEEAEEDDDIKEASYSDKTFSEVVANGMNTLINW